MLNEELLRINKIVQGDIATFDAIKWFIKQDAVKQRSIVSTTRMCLERANPNQDGVDKVYERWQRGISTGLSDIFRERHHDQAIKIASEVPDKDLGDSFLFLIELFRHFDRLQRKTICKNGCDHEWHNLTWNIRTNDIQRLIDFYSRASLKPDYHKHGTTFHYSITNGQSLLNIYLMTKTQKNIGLGLRIKFNVEDFDGIMKALKEKQVSVLNETANSAIIMDPDGRKIVLHKS